MRTVRMDSHHTISALNRLEVVERQADDGVGLRKRRRGLYWRA